MLGDATKLSFDNELFDVIISFETIEHFDANQRDNYLKELYRILKKDGILIISTPNRKITSPNLKKPLNKFHIIEYSVNEIKKLKFHHN